MEADILNGEGEVSDIKSIVMEIKWLLFCAIGGKHVFRLCKDFNAD